MILSSADALTVHLVVESFVTLLGVICSLFSICSLRFSKSFSRFGENLRPLYLNLESGSGSGCNGLSGALCKFE